MRNPVNASTLTDPGRFGVERGRWLRENAHAALERAAQATRDQTFGADRQRTMGGAEEAAGEADAQHDSERYAERVRDWSARTYCGLAHLDPTGTGAKIIKTQQDITDAVEGFEEDGLRGAIGRTAANALDEYAQGVGTTVYEAPAHSNGDTAAFNAKVGSALRHSGAQAAGAGQNALAALELALPK